MFKIIVCIFLLFCAVILYKNKDALTFTMTQSRNAVNFPTVRAPRPSACKEACLSNLNMYNASHPELSDTIQGRDLYNNCMRMCDYAF